MSKFRKNVAVLIFCLLAFSLFAENYTVQKGDTYYSISKKYNISLQELYSANGIDENDVLKVGQVLKIPGKSTAENTSEKSTTTVSTAKTSNYEVVSGDTLYSISKKFGTTVDNLRSLNGLTESSVLKVGQVLKVPSTEKVVTTTGSSSSGSTKTEIKQNTSVTPAAPLEDVRTYDTNK
ncbi:MAG: LysM peptidoglycan-binding domain-containing protein, partial [Ruminococcaceae bacterium]|nr:LysM peptidoglycan-binding domain-containing protein [Oscillospiraceae bacterium]